MLVSYRTRGQRGATPLMHAFDEGKKASIKALIDGGVEINFQNTVCPRIVCACICENMRECTMVVMVCKYVCVCV